VSITPDTISPNGARRDWRPERAQRKPSAYLPSPAWIPATLKDAVLDVQAITQKGGTDTTTDLTASEIATLWHEHRIAEALRDNPDYEVSARSRIWAAYRITWEMGRVCGALAPGQTLSSIHPSDLLIPRRPQMVPGITSSGSVMFAARMFLRWDSLASQCPKQTIHDPLTKSDSECQGLPLWPSTDVLTWHDAGRQWLEIAEIAADWLGLDDTYAGNLATHHFFRADCPPLERWPSFAEILSHEWSWLRETTRTLARRGVESGEKYLTEKLQWSPAEVRFGIMACRQDAVARTICSVHEDRAIMTLKLEDLFKKMHSSLDLRGSASVLKALAVVRNLSKGEDQSDADFSDLARVSSTIGPREFSLLPPGTECIEGEVV